jgi:hypothetical protein
MKNVSGTSMVPLKAGRKVVEIVVKLVARVAALSVVMMDDHLAPTNVVGMESTLVEMMND